MVMLVVSKLSDRGANFSRILVVPVNADRLLFLLRLRVLTAFVTWRVSHVFGFDDLIYSNEYYLILVFRTILHFDNQQSNL